MDVKRKLEMSYSLSGLIVNESANVLFEVNPTSMTFGSLALPSIFVFLHC